MSSKSFICRLCGSAKEEEDIVCELNDLVDEASSGISLLNYISYVSFFTSLIFSFRLHFHFYIVLSS